jgi:hypothetical protein
MKGTIRMNQAITLIALIAAASAFAHDEGHGPKLTDTAKQGGIVAPVIDAKEASKGAKAGVVYKSELVRSEDGTVRVYLYDQDMNPLDLGKLDKSAKGIVEFKKNKKWTKNEFSLSQEEGAFVGKAPKSPSKPFNIDVRVKEGSKELLTAFDNLD